MSDAQMEAQNDHYWEAATGFDFAQVNKTTFVTREPYQCCYSMQLQQQILEMSRLSGEVISGIWLV